VQHFSTDATFPHFLSVVQMLVCAATAIQNRTGVILFGTMSTDHLPLSDRSDCMLDHYTTYIELYRMRRMPETAAVKRPACTPPTPPRPAKCGKK